MMERTWGYWIIHTDVGVFASPVNSLYLVTDDDGNWHDPRSEGNGWTWVGQA